MIEIYSFTKYFLVSLSNIKECERNSSIYPLQANTIKWYTHLLKTNKETGARILVAGIKYSELMGTYPIVFQAEINVIGR